MCFGCSMNSAKAKTKIKKLRTHSGNGSAWLTRQEKDISHLPILHVEESELPVITTENESVLYYIDHIRKIIKSPMLDLSEYSNTDLKLAYGVGNFKVLCEYDENFNHFLLALTNLARACTEAGLYSEAEQTFLLAFHYGSQKWPITPVLPTYICIWKNRKKSVHSSAMSRMAPAT